MHTRKPAIVSQIQGHLVFEAGELDATASKLELRRRQGQTDDFEVGLACSDLRESAPATADFEDALAWPGIQAL